ncbi:MAG: DNA polymerase I [Alphaproteobacteria bacterium]
MSSSVWHIVDASGYIFRAYHALPPMNAPDGTPVNAVYGFCAMMLKLLKDVGGQHVLVVFDAKRRSFRQDLYPDYKAHRPDAPADLVPQFSLIRQAVEAMGLLPLEQEGFEADDLIATLATALVAEGERVCIVSSDKDLMQLVQPAVFMMDPLKNKKIERDQVFEKFGVYPERVVDVQALAGDSSDNIPGISGIGLKTAAELITSFGSLDALLDNAHTITQPKRRERLQEGASMARLSRDLVRLRCDVPLSHPPQDLVRAVNYASFVPFLQTLAFQSLVHRLPAVDAAEKTFAYRSVVSDGDEDALKHTLQTHGLCSFVVTSSGIELCADKETVWALSPSQAQMILPPLFSDPSIRWVSHDAKAQMHRLRPWGLPIKTLPHDTMVMGYILTMTGQTLQATAEQHLNHRWGGVAGEEAFVMWHLFFVLQQKLAAARSMTVYETMDRPLIPVLAQMEDDGIAVDTSVLSSLSQEFGAQMQQLQDRIYLQAGHPFNIGSPKQLSEVLFQEMKLTSGQKSAKTGALSTGSDVLEALVEQGHSIAQDILDWRHYAKLKNTYTDALPQMIDERGRIHTTFSSTVTATGRLSSSDPNLQNIPVRSTQGQKIRTAFYAPPQSVLISCDYSQIELRLLAHLANIETLQQAFSSGEDIHTMTAHHVFGVPLNDVTPAMRYRAKAVNFGMIYGITPFGLARQLGCSKAEAKTIMDAYFARYPGIQHYMTSVLEKARLDNSITTLFGRRIPLFGLGDANPARRAFAERAAINAPLQGTAADLIKRAMIRVAEVLNGYQAKMILQVHDELVFEVPEHEQKVLLPLLVKTMETAHLPDYGLNVPLVVDATVGSRWG